MQFFIPYAKNDADAEQLLAGICKFVQADVPAKGRRVARLTYTHAGRDMVAEVGKPCDPYYREDFCEVIAIVKLRGSCYGVCLPDRGVIRGDPVYVGTQAVARVELFDA